MKILRVIDTLDPRTGGPASGLRALAPVLRAHGHETIIVTLDAPGSPYARLPGAEVIPLGPAPRRHRQAALLGRWLADHLGRFDAVVVHGLWQSLGRSVYLATRDRAVPYFVYPHGMLDPWFRRAYPGKHLKKWLYWQLVERRVLAAAAAVLFTCDEERRLARHSFWPYRCVERVVSYGTTGAPPEDGRQAAAWAAACPETAGRPFLLFLGRIHPKKGIDLLLQAWHALAAHAPAFPALVIAGPVDDPAILRHLQTLVPGGPRVVWTGMLQGDAKWGALRAAEALVLPSHQENFGLVVAEALAAGTPVLISKQVNIWREIVADGAGLAAADTLAGATELLEAWLALNAAARAAMRQRAAECYARRFHIDAVARSFADTIAPFVSPALPALSL